MNSKEVISRRWIYLPVEVKSRELLARVFFAAHAIKAGFGVFIGRNGMNISRDHFPKGIYFDKCLSAHKADTHQHLVCVLGNKLVSLDEEGLLFKSEEVYLNERLSHTSVNLSELIFLWGEEQGRVLSTRITDSGKMVVTGSPRSDTWRSDFAIFYKTEVSQIKKRYGQFILVVSNWGFSHLDKQEGFDPDNIYSGYPHTFVRAAFISLIKTLAKAFPKHTIVVRPHPSDIPEYWMTKKQEFPSNVKVIYEGSISSWVYAATAVIHNNCTTGVEAWVGRTPVIAYSPEIEGIANWNQYTMPVNYLGRVCHDESEVVDCVRASLFETTTSDRSNSDPRIERFLYIDEHQSATEKIIDHLKNINVPAEQYRVSDYNLWRKIRTQISASKWRARDFLGLSGMYTRGYTLHKNPGIELAELQDFFDRMTKIIGVPSDFFRILQVDTDTFCIVGNH
jgi:surface carbohydrate biosynthesis protein